MVGNEDSRMFRNPQQRKTSQDVPFFLDAPVLTPLHSNQIQLDFHLSACSHTTPHERIDGQAYAGGDSPQMPD